MKPSALKVVLVHLALLLATVAALYPVLWVLQMAFSSGQSFSTDPIPWPKDPTLQNFADVVGAPFFLRQLLNSLVISGATAVIGLGLSTTAAYAMSRWAFPGRELGMELFLTTQMFPGVVMAVPLYILLDETGLTDSMVGLILVYATTSVPFSTWNLKGYFDTIPKDLEEAALLDGADRWTTFTRVILPLARPALAVTGLFSFMGAWNEFILAATLLGKEEAFTLPIVLNSYVGTYGTEWGRFAAGAILVSIPVVVLFFALQRHLVEGLTAGSVKG